MPRNNVYYIDLNQIVAYVDQNFLTRCNNIAGHGLEFMVSGLKEMETAN